MIKESLFAELAKRINYQSIETNHRNATLAGVRFTESDFYDLDFSGENISKSLFKNCDFNHTNFDQADLSETVFENCQFSYSSFKNALLDKSRFQNCYLHGSNFSNANLHETTFAKCSLGRAMFDNAKLFDVYFIDSGLCIATFVNAVMYNVTWQQIDIGIVDLSGVKGLPDPSKWMEENFLALSNGYIVYKSFSPTTPYANIRPASWVIKAGEYIEEVVNQSPTVTCGCGVNFGTFGYIQKQFWYRKNNHNIWMCLIEWKDLPSVVVPYNTEGAARCSRLQLIRKIP
jgi:hypothetical protein